MASLNMHGPYSLSTDEVDKEITVKSAGNYAMGSINDVGIFNVKYVGRSDTDLNARLKQHAANKEYKYFKYNYATSPKDAFVKECKNFHD